MSLKDIGNSVAKVAPLLGTALAGPAGTIVGGLIATVFGGDISKPDELLQKIGSDPQSVLKLVQLQSDHELALKNIELQQQQLEEKNVESARQREVDLQKSGYRDWMPTVITILIFIGTFGLISFIIFSKQGGASEQFINIGLGAFIACLLDIKNYYFGGNLGLHKFGSVMGSK